MIYLNIWPLTIWSWRPLNWDVLILALGLSRSLNLWTLRTGAPERQSPFRDIMQSLKFSFKITFFTSMIMIQSYVCILLLLYKQILQNRERKRTDRWIGRNNCKAGNRKLKKQIVMLQPPGNRGQFSGHYSSLRHSWVHKSTTGFKIL